MNQEEINQKILHLITNNEDFKKEKDLFKKLINQCDINLKNDFGNTPLTVILNYNKTQEMNFTNQEIYELLEKCDINQKVQDNKTIMYVLLENIKKEQIKLEVQQIEYFLDKSNFNELNKQGSTLFYKLWEVVHYEKSFF